jgi:hypothetical protein
MANSSAKYVSYDLRPAKQCERKLILEFFACANECGHKISDYRYVGMGANRFYDFILMHKQFSIRKMISLEHNQSMYSRAVFNTPFKFLEVLNQNVSSFALKDTGHKNTIYWLDFDDGIGPGITGDITSIAHNIVENDFLFVTVTGTPTKAYSKLNSAGRRDLMQDTLGDYAASVTVEDTETNNFSDAVDKVLRVALQNIFATRAPIGFRELFRVQYADGLEMVTIGGIISEIATGSAIKNSLMRKAPFLYPSDGSRYKIGKFDFTEKERALFDLAVTSGRKNSREINTLRRMGFKDAEMDRYREVLRYYPRYIETLI